MLCAGIPRSGSTWLYNAARLLLTRQAGASNVCGSWIEQYDASNAAAWHIVKVHEPNESLLWRARVALTSRRDLRDIAASAWKRGWTTDRDSTLAFLDSVVAQHAFWRGRCAYEMAYERMMSDRPAELERIAAALGLGALDHESATAVSREIDALKFDDSREGDFDATSLLHKRHITDGRSGYHADALPDDLVATINQRYAAWLRDNGYSVG